jgi:hypothetical protein
VRPLLLTIPVTMQDDKLLYPPPSSAELKKGGAMPPLPHTYSWHNAKLIKHRDNFLSLYGSTALVDLGNFFTFLIHILSVGLFGGGISPSKGTQMSMPLVGFEPTIPGSNGRTWFMP